MWRGVHAVRDVGGVVAHEGQLVCGVDAQSGKLPYME